MDNAEIKLEMETSHPQVVLTLSMQTECSDLIYHNSYCLTIEGLWSNFFFKNLPNSYGISTFDAIK